MAPHNDIKKPHGSGHAATQQNTTPEGITIGHWDHGLFDCFSSCVPNCLMVTYCPCISMAQIMARLGSCRYSAALLLMLGLYVAEQSCAVLLYGSYDNYAFKCKQTPSHLSSITALDDDWSSSASESATPGCKMTQQSYIWSAALSALQLISVLIIFNMRSRVRARFQIPGNCVGDCCAACCCSCCALAQVATQIKSYTPGSCSFSAADTLPKYEY